VSIRAFLLSKYEMTQGQWVRSAKTNPSFFGTEKIVGGKRISLLHPVESVSWLEGQRILKQLGLRLPSEAEWEYAARAGTTTVWWTGDEKETLPGAANLSDRCLRDYVGDPNVFFEDWLNDGYVIHAPVGSLRPNAFGLHEVCGNVAEWCGDFFSHYTHTPTDGTAMKMVSLPDMIFRGGSWYTAAHIARSAHREAEAQTYTSNNLGLRPAASIEIKQER
jgi:formylglycine-generating enzyme required for sulfatase activity